MQTPTRSEPSRKKLDDVLARVQKKTERDEFIYGVTSREGRSLLQRMQDFFIDRSHVPDQEKAHFFELLAIMIRAGIPLNQALKVMARRTDHARLRRVIATLSHELEHGRPLSAGLERFPEVFIESERGAVKSAEAVGHLDRMLTKLAAFLERSLKVRNQLISALIYPAAVMVSLVLAGGVMFIFVIPRMRELFVESNLAMPLATRILMNTSMFINESWWLGLILAIFCIIGFHSYTHSDQGRFSWDFRKLRLPLVGALLRKVYVLRFTDTLGVLLESGLPINQTLEYVAGSLGNEVYRLKTYDALGAVQEGKKLSAVLATSPFLFPETVTNMMAVGEHAASLGEISQKVAEYFEREINATLKNLTTVIGPLLILFIGTAVAFFALAVLSPVFSLTQSLS